MKTQILATIVIVSAGLSSCTTQETTRTTTQDRTTTIAHTTRQSGDNVKTVNGKRYVYVPAELGSNIPGGWYPEDSPRVQAARQAGTLSSDSFARTQDKGQSLPESGAKLPKFTGGG
ncbi:MAG: hypothetical protein ACR2MW_02840 [Chthoniobacterales bacterium]